MEGNISTGICTTLVTPKTQIKRQTTMMKYGWRIANFAMCGLLHSRGFDDLRRDQFAFLELILLAKHH